MNKLEEFTNYNLYAFFFDMLNKFCKEKLQKMYYL